MNAVRNTFQDELAALIAWTYQDGVPTNSVVGSYAGAVGYPQFMPSNIPKFGVDYDGNGHVDLRNSAVDAIGSIANYLANYGWQRNQPIAFCCTLFWKQSRCHHCQRFKPTHTLWCIQRLKV